MRFERRFSAVAMVLALFLLFSATDVFAQRVTNTFIGVEERDDKHARTPVVTITTVPGETATKLLIDAYQRHPEYTRYPFVFEIYINRQLFTTQYRSNNLPGPIGVDVGTDVAAPPFNFTVITKTVTPNGDMFTTVAEGAAFSSSLAGLLDCTLSFVNGSNADYVKNNVDIIQTGNSSVRVEITNASGIGSDDSADTTLTATISGSSASGTLNSSINDIASTQRSDTVSGSATTSNGEVTDLRVATSDGSVSLNCS